MAVLPLQQDGKDIWELYSEPELDKATYGYTNSSAVVAAKDYSINNRTLQTAASSPIFQTNSINGKGGVFFDGTNNPLKYAGAPFAVRSGLMVVKVNETTAFSSYAGVLTDTLGLGVLVGDFNQGGTPTNRFFDFQTAMFEYRLSDKIYPSTNYLAPINAYRIVFLSLLAAANL